MEYMRKRHPDHDFFELQRHKKVPVTDKSQEFFKIIKKLK